MDEQKLISELVERNETKIIHIVLDGLGGLPVKDGKSELELSETPNLDKLVKESATGLHIPVSPGISPGRRHKWRGLWDAGSSGCSLRRDKSMGVAIFP